MSRMKRQRAKFHMSKGRWLMATTTMLFITTGTFIVGYLVRVDRVSNEHAAKTRQPVNEDINQLVTFPDVKTTGGKTNRSIREARSAAADATDRGNPITTIGEWGIFRDVDPMTDVTDCSAAYYSQETNTFFQPYVRLNYDKSSYAIFFVIDDYAKSYRVRINDDPVSDWKNQIPLLGSKGIIQIYGEIYQRALTSTRMRVEVVGLTTSQIFDVNTKHIGDAVRYMSTDADCR